MSTIKKHKFALKIAECLHKQYNEVQQELMLKYDELEIKKKHTALKINGLKKITTSAIEYNCAIISTSSYKVIKTVIEIYDGDCRCIEDFYDNIEFTKYYINDEEIELENYKGILLDYTFEIGNEREFKNKYEKYKVTRREIGYDRNDIYISWKIPVEIGFDWYTEMNTSETIAEHI